MIEKKNNDPLTRVWQKWRFSAPQKHLCLIKHWFSPSIPKLRDGENRHLRQARKRWLLTFDTISKNMFIKKMSRKTF